MSTIMARSAARVTYRMSVALGQAPLAYESLLLGPLPLAEAAQQLQLLGRPTQLERTRIRVALGPAGEPLPTPTEGVALHGGHSPGVSPAGEPLPDIRESARPLRHSRP